MMYSEKIVAAIKVDGKILRESGDTVTLPFGCEFSILLKNLNSVRALVSISVDGKDVTEGTKLVIAPNSSIELERFIHNGNLHSGNRFKFIERTKGIEDHRGIGSDDGLIRVEAWREHVRPVVNVPIVRHHYYDHYFPARPWPWNSGDPWWNRTTGGICSQLVGSSNNSANSVNTANANPSNTSHVKSASPLRSSGFRSFDYAVDDCSFEPQEVERGDAGITVAGSESQQKFYSTSGFETETGSAVVVLRLRGEFGGTPVAKPAYVEVKLKCDTCGRKNSSSYKFCYWCGTALQLI